VNASSTIPRKEILEAIEDTLKKTSLLVISSPPATGKTSLMNLLAKNHPSANFKHIQFTPRSDARQVLDSSLHSLEGQAGVIIIDDAQNKYEDEDFWFYLVKGIIAFYPQYSFIICATHTLGIYSASPVVLESYPHIRRDDLLLSHEEARDLIIRSFDINEVTIEDMHHAMNVIENMSGRVVGQIRMITWKLSQNFRKQTPSESDILQYLLGDSIIGNDLGRLFGVDVPQIDPSLFECLRSCFLSGSTANVVGKNSEILELIKRGVLALSDYNQATDEVKITFTTPLARRYLMNRIFPDRGNSDPTDVKSLVVSAIEKMSAFSLLQSTPDQNLFPKEAVFQHLFMNSLLACLPANFQVCPELSIDFQGSSTSGEIDFYIDGNLRWGIELLIKGSKLKEHISRFQVGGLYYPLAVNQFAVVDFRFFEKLVAPTVKFRENTIIVYFQAGDFSKCFCASQFNGCQEKFELKLQD
jgi:hypothetical protein